MSTPLMLERPTGWVRYTPLLLLPLPIMWFAYVLAYNPTDRLPDLTGPCLWHALFHIDGPTCGFTRMTWYLLHGDLLDAARMHLAALLLVPVGAYAYLWWVVGWLFGWRLPMIRIRKSAVIVALVAFLLYTMVLRNLPWPPFSWFYVPNVT
jgi:Protein of unknown function (DUF2752)